MIKEAINYVAMEAERRAHNERKFVYEPREPEHIYFTVRPDGTVERCVADPAPRDYTARSIAGLCAQVTELIKTMPDGPVCIFVGRENVVAVLGELDRRDRVTLPLRLTEPYKVLADGRALAGVKQNALLWILRSCFRNNVHPLSFVPDIKQIKFRSNTDSQSDVGQGRQSIGKSVMAEMLGVAGELPEEIQLVCPVYEDLGDPELVTEFTCYCAVGINLADQEFTVKPMPGEVESGALKSGVKIAERIEWRLGELVTGGKVKVFVHSEP